MNINPKYIVIGDVHGDYIALEKMLCKVNIVRNKYNSNHWISKDGYKAILLGDLNDYRSNNPYLSSWKTLCIGMELCKSNVGIVLHSNHQEKLIQYLNNSCIAPGSSFNKTINELKQLETTQIDKLNKWLLDRPLTYSFNLYGTNYSCVHAYFPNPQLEEENPYIYKDLCINGVLNDEGKRVLWWEYPELVDINRTVLCGHYHVIINKPHVIVIDGNCGNYNKGLLIGYIPSKKKYIRVLNSGWNKKQNPSSNQLSYVH